MQPLYIHITTSVSVEQIPLIFHLLNSHIFFLAFFFLSKEVGILFDK